MSANPYLGAVSDSGEPHFVSRRTTGDLPDRILAITDGIDVVVTMTNGDRLNGTLTSLDDPGLMLLLSDPDPRTGAVVRRIIVCGQLSHITDEITP